MILICCVDDRMGMMFGGHRLSRDSILIDRIMQLSSKTILWINKYSHSLFDKAEACPINISANFISEAKNGDFCFVENLSVSSFEKSIEMIILYKWNRTYPFDLSFDIDLSNWKLVESNNIKGNSHKIITEEFYIRNA